MNLRLTGVRACVFDAYKEFLKSTRHFLCVNRELHTGIIQPMWFESKPAISLARSSV